MIQTLTKENFSFDIIIDNNNNTNKKLGLNENNIEQILEIIKQRKKKVEMTKKYLEEKMI